MIGRERVSDMRMFGFFHLTLYLVFNIIWEFFLVSEENEKSNQVDIGYSFPYYFAL